MDLDAIVKTLIANGVELRKAGIRELRAGDVHVIFAPVDVPVDVTPPDEDIADPLDDPMTFGRKSSLPGFDREDRS